MPRSATGLGAKTWAGAVAAVAVGASADVAATTSAPARAQRPSRSTGVPSLPKTWLDRRAGYPAGRAIAREPLQPERDRRRGRAERAVRAPDRRDDAFDRRLVQRAVAEDEPGRRVLRPRPVARRALDPHAVAAGGVAQGALLRPRRPAGEHAPP